MNTMEPIQFSGISELNEDEKQVLKDICAKGYDRIKMFLHNENTSVNVHIKTYRQKGDKKKYSVTLKAIAPTTKVFRSGTSDWILNNALNDAFAKVEQEIRNHFKI